jgi:hypothetical protein
MSSLGVEPGGVMAQPSICSREKRPAADIESAARALTCGDALAANDLLTRRRTAAAVKGRQTGCGEICFRKP